jgi:hypothetical protein
MKTKIMLLFLLLFIIGCSEFEEVPERTLPNSDQTIESYTIQALKELNPVSGRYNIDAYVVMVYTCPPCPKDAMCKVCMGDNILVSDINELKESYSFTGNELIVFAKEPKQFELGMRYRFTISILSHNPSNSVNSVDLVGYDLLAQ